jgi:hypothetical protein
MKAVILSLLCVAGAWPATGGCVELPFRQDRTLRVLRVDGVVDGKPAVLLLDTGATRSLVDADRIGVRRAALPRATTRTGPGIRSAGIVRRVALELGGREWEERRMLAVDFGQFRDVYGAEVVGIIGQDMLMEFSAVEIDYRRGRITMRD